MPRKRLSKDDLVERIRTGLDTKGWEITKTATRAMLDELGVVAREELVQGNEFAAPGIVLLQTEKRSSRQGVRHVAQRVDRQRHGRTTRGPARRPAAPRAYDTRPRCVDRQRHGRTTARRPAAPRAPSPGASTGSATGVRHAAQRVDRQRHGRTTRGPARRPAAPRAYDTRPRCVDRQRHGRTTRGPGASTSSSMGVTARSPARRLPAPWAYDT